VLKETRYESLRVALYCGSWPQNIGNAFFDLGAEATIRKALPGVKIYRVGGAVHWMFDNSYISSRGIMGKARRKMLPSHFPTNGNSLEIGEIVEADLIVFAGMSMCEEFVKTNAKTIIAANNHGIPVLGIGTGASQYSTREVEIFGNFISELTNCSIITRDDETFSMFKNSISSIYPGSDCALFLPEYYKPPSLVVSNFDVLTFDNQSIPKDLNHLPNKKFYTHHNLWGPLPRKYMQQRGTLISDVPEDYLTLYANCQTTYSDRVHACLASLVYGNSAKLFSQTPRKALFKKLGVQNITKEVVKLDMQLLLALKAKQILLVQEAVSKLV
jgi:hypothetical protein